MDKLRILMVHSYYGAAAPSGENMVFDQECELLKNRGHEIFRFTKNSDQDIGYGITGLLKAGLKTPWNEKARKSFELEIKRIKPDVIHVHNTFPNISPSIFWAKRGDIPLFLTLHNYRIACPAAIPMRGGHVCTLCIEKRNTLYSVLFGCYRNSRFATIPLAISIALHSLIGTWKNRIDGLIALTSFQKDVVTMFGAPQKKVFVKPNFFKGHPDVIPWDKRENAVVFAGRISKEKGVSTLIDSWTKWGSNAPQLHIYGDGPEKDVLVEKSVNMHNITWHGQCKEHVVHDHISKCKLVVLPSMWFEGFPMVLREAFTFGTPSIVSDLGPLPSLVYPNSGLSFKAGDSASLLQTFLNVWNDDAKLQQMSKAARLQFEEKYTEESNYNELMRLYNGHLKK